MRYIFAGAERLRPETRQLYAERFGVRVLEGYGATETAPVLALNTPMHSRPGAAGRLLPGMQYRLDPVEGIHTGGRLVVQGPNVMLGYLRHTAPGVLETLPGGWYDTGRYLHGRRPGLHHHTRARQAFRQDRRRDGLHGGGRVAGRGACGPTRRTPWSRCRTRARARRWCC